MKSKLLSLIARMALKVPNAIGLNNYIVVLPVTHFVRGFFFEPVPRKGEYYTWMIFVPIFREMKNVTLNYSRRVSLIPDSNCYIECEKYKEDDLENIITISILDKFIGEIDNISTISELSYLIESKVRYNRINIYFDYAIAKYLSGEEDFCLNILEGNIINYPDNRDINDNIKNVARGYADLIRTGNGEALRGVINKVEMENIGRLFPGMPSR